MIVPARSFVPFTEQRSRPSARVFPRPQFGREPQSVIDGLDDISRHISRRRLGFKRSRHFSVWCHETRPAEIVDNAQIEKEDACLDVF
jgi:hypothetical protein